MEVYYNMELKLYTSLLNDRFRVYKIPPVHPEMCMYRLLLHMQSAESKFIYRYWKCPLLLIKDIGQMKT